MTENKRFTIKRKNLKYAKILENGKDLTGYFFIAQAEFICDKWNELSEENEQLKQSYAKLKHRHDLLHDEYIDAECERYSLKKEVESLEKENEQLKKEHQGRKLE